MEPPQNQLNQEPVPVKAPAAKAAIPNGSSAQKLGAVKPAIDAAASKAIAPTKPAIAEVRQPPSPKKSQFAQINPLQLLTVGLLVVILGLLLGLFVKLLTLKNEPTSAEQKVIVPATNTDRSLESDPNLASNYPATPEKINRDRFNQIKKGMTLKQVEGVIGNPGKLIADSSTPNGTGQVYSWKNPQGSNAIVEFKNGKVAAKAQAGL
ncbi:MAG: hypothetical protein HC856_08010 [Pseudanabaena sp. RU_4_16]|nr:hypothetical protein [Pseudanabaena sp. RU_4_16]